MARPLAVNRFLTARAGIFRGRLVCNAVLAGLIAVGVGPGQSPPAAAAAAPPGTASLASSALSPEARAAVDERINELQSRLGITAAQQALWSAFAQAMRDNAAATDALFAQRAAAVSTMSAVENMHSYAEIARAYADNTARLATAFDSLYTSLSEAQKHAADSLFREHAVAAAKLQSGH
jgi:LTXXQ motif family protein